MGRGPIFLDFATVILGSLLLPVAKSAVCGEADPDDGLQGVAQSVCFSHAAAAPPSAESLVQAQRAAAKSISGFDAQAEAVVNQVKEQHEESKRSLARQKDEFEGLLKEQVKKTRALVQTSSSLRAEIQAQDEAQVSLLGGVKELQLRNQRMREALASYANMLQTARRFAAAAWQESDDKASKEVAMVEESIAPPTAEALLEVAGSGEVGRSSAAASAAASPALALLQQTHLNADHAVGAVFGDGPPGKISTAEPYALLQAGVEQADVQQAVADPASAAAAAAKEPAASLDELRRAVTHALGASALAGVPASDEGDAFVEDLAASLQEVQRAQQQGRQVLKAKFLSLAEEQQERYSQAAQEVWKLNETLAERKRQNVALSQAKTRVQQTHDDLDSRFVALNQFLLNLSNAVGSTRKANAVFQETDEGSGFATSSQAHHQASFQAGSVGGGAIRPDLPSEDESPQKQHTETTAVAEENAQRASSSRKSWSWWGS